jgi:sugar phosphate permease
MTGAADPARSLRAWQLRLFGLLWGAYASYYLCRVNFAVAQPAILKEFPDWTNAQVGSIPSTFAAVYAVGQLVNGALGQHYGARRLMTMALLLAATTNLLFAFTSSFAWMQVLWALNGWGQSAGWSLMVQTVSNWHTAERRGILIGRLSTCYQVGNVVSWLLAGVLCESVGWRAAFVVPSLVLLPVAVVVFLFLRDCPAEAGFRTDVGAARGPDAGTSHDSEHVVGQTGWRFTWHMITLTFSHRGLWVLAAGSFVLNAVRYSFMNWSVHYMVEFHARSVRMSVLTAIVIPLVGALGAISAGWASDRLFGRRRAPVCVIMLAGLTAVCAVLAVVPAGNWRIATLLLALAGFMIYGPDMLISGVATVDLSHPRAASIATGLTMCLGALGAIFSGVGVGRLKDLAPGSWSLVFWVLAALPLIPAALMTTLWHARPEVRH